MTLPGDDAVALVTGASSGIGAEFARQLAPTTRTLVLVARREERLAELAAELEAGHAHLSVRYRGIDLTQEADRESLLTWLADEQLAPDLLVNNAGMGDYGELASAEWPKLQAMIRLNMEALTWLTHAVLPGMLAVNQGAILHVSSIASLLPIPDFAVYAATKAYVTSFSEALRLELREHGIRVSALCPGPVHTEFGEVAMRADGRGGPAHEWFYVETAEVVAEGLRGLERNAPRIFPGWPIAMGALVLGLLPMIAVRALMAQRPRR